MAETDTTTANRRNITRVGGGDDGELSATRAARQAPGAVETSKHRRRAQHTHANARRHDKVCGTTDIIITTIIVSDDGDRCAVGAVDWRRVRLCVNNSLVDDVVVVVVVVVGGGVDGVCRYRCRR